MVYEGLASEHRPRGTAEILDLGAHAAHPQGVAHYLGLYFMSSRGAQLVDKVEIGQFELLAAKHNQAPAPKLVAFGLLLRAISRSTSTPISRRTGSGHRQGRGSGWREGDHDVLARKRPFLRRP